MGYVAVARLRFGDGWIEPGEPVPVEPHRRYDQMLLRNEIAEVPDSAGESGDTPAELDDLTRDELNERADESGVDDPESLPNKAAVKDAIQTHEELDALTRKELNKLAADAGVENPEKLPNKSAVIEALSAARSGDTPA